MTEKEKIADVLEGILLREETGDEAQGILLVLRHLYNFMSVDQLKEFLEYIKKEYDI
jgi:hypothetical protein